MYPKGASSQTYRTFPSGAFDGHGDAPIQVSGHGPALQTAIHPTLALASHVGLPGLGVVVLFAIQNPVLQVGFEPRFVPVHGQIPQRGFAHFRGAAAQGAFGVNQFVWGQSRPAFFTLVSISPVVLAFGARSLDVAIGQKLLFLRIVKLLSGFFCERPLFEQFQEEFLCKSMVLLTRSAVVMVKCNVQPRERLLHLSVVPVHDGPRSGSLFSRPEV